MKSTKPKRNFVDKYVTCRAIDRESAPQLLPSLARARLFWKRVW